MHSVMKYRVRVVRAMLMVAAAASLTVALAASTASAAAPTVGFGFAAPDVSGFPADHGSVALTGGGAFKLNPAAGSVHAGGGFSCTSDASTAFFTGCLSGEGVRWDTDQLLPSTNIKCTGSAGESLKPVSTSADTVVLKADFYRAGDGIDESFTAQMIVSTRDIAPDIQGFQNVWVQGVGCGTAMAHFGA
jgi:hypothetical protein